MISPAPTTATSSGLSPARIDGITNSTSTAKLSSNAPIAASPCHRPSRSTAAAKSTARTTSDQPRWKSTIWYDSAAWG